MAATYNAKSPTIKRILKEAAELANQPSPDYTASPASDSNLFDWHFTLRGPPSSPYAAGIYHGRIILPPQYPHRPPAFRFLTPSGRFETNRDICLSMSAHHEESWQPAWGIRTALVALRSFMDEDVKGQVGGMEGSREQRERWAGESPVWRCGGCCGGKNNVEIMKEVGDRCAEEGVVERKEDVVPEGLGLGYRDELGKGRRAEGQEKEAVGNSAQGEGSRVEEELEVRAVPTPTRTYPEAKPAQTVPQPTAPLPGPQLRARVTTVPDPQTVQQRLRQPTRVPANEADVPAWLDRLIIGVIVSLALVIGKVMLGY